MSSLPLSVFISIVALGVFLGKPCAAFGILGAEKMRSRHSINLQLSSDNDSSQNNKILVSKSSESTFWHTIPNKDQDDDHQQSLPCVPTLDADGPLPPGAYLTHGDPQYDPKSTCRVSVALDFSFNDSDDTPMDPNVLVVGMQRLIDGGLTSFQLKPSSKEWAEEQIYCRLRQNTPRSIIRQCQLTIPLLLPIPKDPDDTESLTALTPAYIRKTLLESASRMGVGSDALDNVQLQLLNVPQHRSRISKSFTPHVLDVLDCLEDMKRDGLLRSVSASSLPNHLMQSAAQCKFHVESNQFDTNVLDPSNYEQYYRGYQSKDKTPKGTSSAFFATSPLAGGLLTNRHIGQDRLPHPWTLSSSDKSHLSRTLLEWGRHQGEDDSTSSLWTAYQSKVLDTLLDIARGYRVSVASVALRWLLQCDKVSSTVISCSSARLQFTPDEGLTERLGKDQNRIRRTSRVQELREVFSFSLDDEDMERIWELSGREQDDDPSVEQRMRFGPSIIDAEDDEELLLLKELMEEEGYDLADEFSQQSIDFSNRNLWL